MICDLQCPLWAEVVFGRTSRLFFRHLRSSPSGQKAISSSGVLPREPTVGTPALELNPYAYSPPDYVPNSFEALKIFPSFLIRLNPALRGYVRGCRGPVMDIITGRAPPSHEPTYSNPRRVKSSHGLGCSSSDSSSDPSHILGCGSLWVTVAFVAGAVVIGNPLSRSRSLV